MIRSTPKAYKASLPNQHFHLHIENEPLRVGAGQGMSLSQVVRQTLGF